ncbi:MAG: histidinol-phosphate aminotransferase [Planctomycetota bacterium]
MAEAMPQTLVVLDAAYGELAGADPTMEVLDLPNVVVVRTFSKAWGLASLRVGYLLGSETNIAMLGASGNPFPVSQMAANLALARLRSGESDMLEYARQVRFEREDLMACFETYGYSCAKPNEANFVLVRGLPVLWFKDSLGALGIAVRIFPDRPELQDAVRISLPGDDLVFARLKEALAIVMEPEAILFDLDGVLADVSRSYREAIIGTAAEFGVALTAGDIEEAKRRGQANDDWELTRTLIAERAVPPDLAEVTERFERLYQGTELEEGLRERETLLVSKADLQGWAARFRIGIVTGRPRRDAERFLERFALSGTFEVLVCREDAALKPSPEPVMLALGSLGVKRAWMLGDTRDDLEAARIAGVLPVGVIPPGVDPGPCRAGLMANGASLVVQNAQEIGEYLSCK